MTNTILVTLMIIVVAIIIVVIFNKNKDSNKIKSSAVKKDEIIANYQKQLEDILKKYKDDNSARLKQKKIFLKKCNNELSRNIFFTQSQAHKVIEKLSKL